MKLKNPIIIQSEIKRIESVIVVLHQQLKSIEDKETKKVCTMSLNEHMIRKASLEWVFK